ncbi:MAG TPA: DUF1080 domain-containing protein [Blastocatellia bacterium]|nr:DUF1080 domain-containing protein [Blastocatellia bacterium]
MFSSAVLLLALAAVAAAQSQRLDNPKPAASKAWRQLFNGRDADGWEHVGPGRFKVEDGVLVSEGGMGLLWYTREKFGNCVIRVVYKATSVASNSGVYVRIADRPKDEWFAVHHGYEVQICDKQNEYHRTGAIYSLSKSTKLATNPPGRWNTMEITLKGDLITVAVNGVRVNTFDPKRPVPERKEQWEPERGPRPQVGYIGIQNHDDYATGEHVYFKEVSVRPL